MDRMIYGLHDRRKLLRNKIFENVTKTLLINKNQKILCEVINISGDGLCIEISNQELPYQEGEKLFVYFPELLTKEKKTIYAEYCIKWIKLELKKTKIGLDLTKDLCNLNNILFVKNQTDIIPSPDRRTRTNSSLVSEKRLNFNSKHTNDFPLNLTNTPYYRRSGDERRKNRANNNPRSKSDRRKTRPDPEVKNHFIFQSIKSIVTVTRDLFLLKFSLPNFILKLLIGEGDFVFIAHPRDFSDVSRMFPFAKFLPEKFVKKWFYYQWPFIASKVTTTHKLKNKPISGWIVISPLWTTHMMKDNEKAREKILYAVKLAENINAKVVGLGAFTSIVTHDGLDLLGKTKIGVTTGNPLSSAVAIANLTHAFDLIDADISKAKVAIVGAAGSVGSGCAKVLMEHVQELHLIDINTPKLEKLTNQLLDLLIEGKHTTKISTAINLDRVKMYDAVIVVTNATGAIVNEKHLKSGAIVIDCAQPKNVSKNVPIIRNDVIVIESAIIESAGLDCKFDLDLNKGEALGCLAECIVLSSIQLKNPIVIGKYDASHIADIYAEAQKIGINLAYFRNSHGFITEQDINRVKEIVNKNKDQNTA